MTTIAYKDGILAGDSRETEGSEHDSWVVLSDNCNKVFRLKDGRLFGGAASSESIIRLHESLLKGLPAPKLEDVFGLLIDRRHRIWLYEGNIWQRVHQKYTAIGSGSVFAFAAMDAGATAVEACRIGVRRDPYSGGKVTSVRLR